MIVKSYTSELNDAPQNPADRVVCSQSELMSLFTPYVSSIMGRSCFSCICSGLAYNTHCFPVLPRRNRPPSSPGEIARHIRFSFQLDSAQPLHDAHVLGALVLERTRLRLETLRQRSPPTLPTRQPHLRQAELETFFRLGRAHKPQEGVQRILDNFNTKIEALRGEEIACRIICLTDVALAGQDWSQWVDATGVVYLPRTCFTGCVGDIQIDWFPVL